MKSLPSKEYVIQETETSSYKLQHEVIHRMVLIVFGTYQFDKLFQYAKQEDLKEWIQKNMFCSNCFKSSLDSNSVLENNEEQLGQFEEI